MKNKPALTEEQRRALAESQEPVYVVDVNSDSQYVLIAAREYQRYRALFETDEFDISASYLAQEQALDKVWDDPELDEYHQNQP